MFFTTHFSKGDFAPLKTLGFGFGCGGAAGSSGAAPSTPLGRGLEGAWDGVDCAVVIWASFSAAEACRRWRCAKMACCIWIGTPAFLPKSLKAWICWRRRLNCCAENWLTSDAFEGDAPVTAAGPEAGGSADAPRLADDGG